MRSTRTLCRTDDGRGEREEGKMLVRVEVLVADVERAVKYIETAKSKKANTITHPILDLILAPPGLEHQFRYLHPPHPQNGVPL